MSAAATAPTLRRMVMTLDALRARRYRLAGLLMPLMLASWLGAAAAPCAAMAVGGDHASEHATTGDAIVDHPHGDHHQTHDSAETSSHPACPHCAHDRDGAGTSDAAAHAACGEAPANVTVSLRLEPDRPDLLAAIPAASETVTCDRAADVFVRLHAGGVPPPTRALYLRYCLFLN